jgi:hypothetical protein
MKNNDVLLALDSLNGTVNNLNILRSNRMFDNESEIKFDKAINIISEVLEIIETEAWFDRCVQDTLPDFMGDELVPKTEAF